MKMKKTTITLMTLSSLSKDFKKKKTNILDLDRNDSHRAVSSTILNEMKDLIMQMTYRKLRIIAAIIFRSTAMIIDSLNP